MLVSSSEFKSLVNEGLVLDNVLLGVVEEHVLNVVLLDLEVSDELGVLADVLALYGQVLEAIVVKLLLSQSKWVHFVILVDLNGDGVEKTIVKSGLARVGESLGDLIDEVENVAVEDVDELEDDVGSVVILVDSSVIVDVPLLVLKDLNLIKEISVSLVVF